jgi:hypothetical protein
MKRPVALGGKADIRHNDVQTIVIAGCKNLVRQ